MDFTITDRLVGVFADKAELSIAELTPDRTLQDIGLDSLHLMEIALWVQREFDVSVAEGDLHHDQTLGEALAFLRERTG